MKKIKMNYTGFPKKSEIIHTLKQLKPFMTYPTVKCKTTPWFSLRRYACGRLHTLYIDTSQFEHDLSEIKVLLNLYGDYLKFFLNKNVSTDELSSLIKMASPEMYTVLKPTLKRRKAFTHDQLEKMIKKKRPFGLEYSPVTVVIK